MFNLLSKFKRQAGIFPATYNPAKRELIDEALRGTTVHSFADLGGVWGVDGWYAFYLLDHTPATRAYLVDTNFTPAVLQHAQRYPQLALLRENFDSPAVIEKMGALDLVLLFDVLLHQVAPQWDEVLKHYSRTATMIAVFNPQWIGEKTVRLLDLGERAYFENVPHTPDHPSYRFVFEDPKGIDPATGRARRDSSSIWQWGIVDRELIQTMWLLGYNLRFFKHYGRFGSLRNFENHGFIFRKR